MKQALREEERAAAELINKLIAELPPWQGQLIALIRKLVHEAAPEITEEWKWGAPVWSQNGLICSAGAFQDHVKLNFFKGASLPDPDRLFNAGLDAKATRAIDLREDDQIDEVGIKDLIRAAVAYNQSGGKKN